MVRRRTCRRAAQTPLEPLRLHAMYGCTRGKARKRTYVRTCALLPCVRTHARIRTYVYVRMYMRSRVIRTYVRIRTYVHALSCHTYVRTYTYVRTCALVTTSATCVRDVRAYLPDTTGIRATCVRTYPTPLAYVALRSHLASSSSTHRTCPRCV